MSYVTKSPWIIHYDGSSCNGCDIEVLACLTPMYDVERFGIINTGNPKHADIFLVTGAVNEQNKGVVQQIYEQMPEPKVVVAVGICACNGGVFKECYNILGGTDTVIPVDVYVPGCAARPESIIDGVVKGLGVLAEKRAAMDQAPAISDEKAEPDEESDEPAEDDAAEAGIASDEGSKEADARESGSENKASEDQESDEADKGSADEAESKDEASEDDKSDDEDDDESQDDNDEKEEEA